MKAKYIAMAAIICVSSCRRYNNPQPDCIAQPEMSLITKGTLSPQDKTFYLETEDHRVFKLDIVTPQKGNAHLTIEDKNATSEIRLDYAETAKCTRQFSAKGKGSGVNDVSPKILKIEANLTKVARIPAGATIETLSPL